MTTKVGKNTTVNSFEKINQCFHQEVSKGINAKSLNDKTLVSDVYVDKVIVTAVVITNIPVSHTGLHSLHLPPWSWSIADSSSLELHFYLISQMLILH